jgi:type IV secretory pathway TrbL component
MNRNSVIGLALAFAAGAAIAGGLTGAESAEWTSGRAAMDEIAAGSCASDSQCSTVAIGAKACGGPAGYKAFPSSKASAMASLARRDRELSKLANDRSGLAGDCRAVIDPGAICQSGRCMVAKRIVAEPPSEKP